MRYSNAESQILGTVGCGIGFMDLFPISSLAYCSGT